MAFVIGNVKDSNINKLEKALSLSLSPGNSKIYGMKFLRDSNDGSIIYDAKDLMFTPIDIDFDGSNNLYYKQTPIDDFNIPGSPFDIKFVMTEYNPDSDRQEVVGTEDDANWMDLVKANTYGVLDYNADDHTSQGDSYLDDANYDPQYNWMVRFPLFYYKRPDRNTFLVSSDPVEGFTPSPMHYRGGKLYKYCYVSKFHVKEFDGYLRSINHWNYGKYNLKTNNVKDWLYQEKLYPLDFASYEMIQWLIYFKYYTYPFQTVRVSEFIAVSDWTKMIGDQKSKFKNSVFKTDYDTTLLAYEKNFDIYLKDIHQYPVTCCMGLSRYGTDNYTNAKYKEFIDGLVGYNNALYFNNDLEKNRELAQDVNYDGGVNYGWQEVLGVDANTINTSFNSDILYNNGHPWIFLPENNTNTYSSNWYNTANIVPASGSAINFYKLGSSGYNKVNLESYNLTAGDFSGVFRSQFVSDEITV